MYLFCSFYLILYIIWFQFSLSLSPFYYFDHYEHQCFTSVLFHMFSFIKSALFGSYSWMSHRTFIESSAVTTAFWLDQYGGRFASIFRRWPPSIFWGQWYHLPTIFLWGRPLILLPSGGGRTRLPKFKFSAKFPIGLHVILQIQIRKLENDCYIMWKIILTENPSRFNLNPSWNNVKWICL